MSERGPDVLDRLSDVRLGPLGRPLRPLLSTDHGRYLVVAGSVQLGYLLLLAALLATGMWYMLAILLAQLVTISVAFPTYRALVFRSTGPWRPAVPRFLGVWAGGAGAGLVLTPLLVETTPINPFAAQVLSIVVVAVASFLAHRFVTFREHHHRGDGPGDVRAG